MNDVVKKLDCEYRINIVEDLLNNKLDTDSTLTSNLEELLKQAKECYEKGEYSKCIELLN